VRELFYVAMLSCTCAITGLLAVCHTAAGACGGHEVRLCRSGRGVLIAADSSLSR